MLMRFLQMLIRPGRAVEAILADPPSFGRLTWWVSAVGVTRGAVEGLWILLMAGQLQAMLAKGEVTHWYLAEAGPFVLANVLTGLFRWGFFAVIPYVLGRFADGSGKWTDFLRVYGVGMGIYVVTILPNFAYLGWNLPAIQFEVSRYYNPVLGVGQVITSLWLAWFGYVTVRRIHRLPAVDSFLIGIAVPAANLGLFVIASKLFFNLQPLLKLSRPQLFWLSTGAFIAAALVAVPAVFWFGFRHARSETGVLKETEVR